MRPAAALVYLASVARVASRVIEFRSIYPAGALLKTPAATLLEYFAPSFEHIPSQILSVTGLALNRRRRQAKRPVYVRGVDRLMIDCDSLPGNDLSNQNA